MLLEYMFTYGMTLNAKTNKFAKKLKNKYMETE